MFGKKTAATLDTAAAALHETGKKIGGEKGGRVGDAIATAALAGLRARCNTNCTRTDCHHA